VRIVNFAAKPSASMVRPAFIEPDGVSLRCQPSGSGAHTVLLLHEMSSFLECWGEIAPYHETDHCVLKYDARGFGLLEKVWGPLARSPSAPPRPAGQMADALPDTRFEVLTTNHSAELGGAETSWWCSASRRNIGARSVLAPSRNTHRAHRARS
jgi:hypothetical protein